MPLRRHQLQEAPLLRPLLSPLLSPLLRRLLRPLLSPLLRRLLSPLLSPLLSRLLRRLPRCRLASDSRSGWWPNSSQDKSRQDKSSPPTRGSLGCAKPRDECAAPQPLPLQPRSPPPWSPQPWSPQQCAPVWEARMCAVCCLAPMEARAMEAGGWAVASLHGGVRRCMDLGSERTAAWALVVLRHVPSCPICGLEVGVGRSGARALGRCRPGVMRAAREAIGAVEGGKRSPTWPTRHGLSSVHAHPSSVRRSTSLYRTPLELAYIGREIHEPMSHLRLGSV